MQSVYGKSLSKLNSGSHSKSKSQSLSKPDSIETSPAKILDPIDIDKSYKYF